MQRPLSNRLKSAGIPGWLCGLMLLANAGAAEPAISFNRDIRPLLSDRCFSCHGFDARARKGELRLDIADGAYAVYENRAAIVPGNPAASSVWQRITTTDPEDVMPPADSHLKLSEVEKKLLRRWIQGGAAYEPHWTFQRVVKPTPPLAGVQPLDAFVGNRLAREKLAFAPDASKTTLIRRLSLDLRGIPPSAEEVKSFAADTAPDAYEKWVDRFLADPAYGERMAWPWLDAARYADSNGFQGDADRTAWPWRDWVVDAFNRNLPYDQFTVWQLAGDLLPDATDEQILATGFLRNHPINGEGGRIPEENRVDYGMDMAETTGTVWMGLTFNCCRCHDHKYDPLTQRDYYSLYAFFNQTPVDGSGGNPQTPPVIAVTSEAQREREAEMVRESEANRASQTARAEEIALQPAWEAEQLAQNPWNILPIETVAGTESKVLNDGSILTFGANPVNVTYTVRALAVPGRLTAVRLDALLDPSMTSGGIARSDSGNFVLTGFELVLVSPDGSRRPVEFSDAAATFEQGGLYQAKGAIDTDPQTGWAVYAGKAVDRNQAAIFRLAAPLDVSAGSVFEFTLRHDSINPHHNLGRFRLAVSGAELPALPSPAGIVLGGILKIPPSERSPDQLQVVREEQLRSDPEWRRLAEIRDRLAAEKSALRASLPKVMVMADRKELRSTHVLAVGAYDKPLEEVTAATPGILPPLTPAESRANRLDLARWLVSRDHPLTARVTINRIWQEFFGIGLIKTPENFGVQSEVPVYPELLDWLAADFMDSGWDLKRLVRTIVTSRTYRQASGISPELLEKDPDNRLLARGPRFRLPSWMIRDQALAASGLMVARVGGPPVKPYQPENLWPDATFGKVKYVRDTGDALYRRSLYTFWRRISMPPMFFDNAKREACSVNPSRTNTPLHALFTLNDVTFVEAARVLAARSAEAVGNEPAAILGQAFEKVLCRPPTAAERAILLDAYGQAKKSFTDDPAAAAEFLANGDSPADSALPAIDHAALASVCLSLFNLDEALTKE